MDYASRFNIVGIFSTAEAESMNEFLSLINEARDTNYLYIHVTPEAGNTCRKNVLSISFFIIYLFFFFHLYFFNLFSFL